MIRSLATTAISSEGGSKNGNRIEGARCKTVRDKLDVAPSRLATNQSPDQPDDDGSENLRVNSNNDAQNPSSVYSSCQRFFHRGSDQRSFPHD
jgi:hypothetical protein